MLYVMLAYLMLVAALSNAVCFYNGLFFFAIDFCKCFQFHAFLGLLTQFVYFKYDFSSCAVLLICSFLLNLCSHNFLYEWAVCSLEKKHLKITIIIKGGANTALL